MALVLVFFVLGGYESSAGGLLPPVPNRTGNTTAPTDFDDGGAGLRAVHPDPVRVQVTIYQSSDDVGLQGSSHRCSYNTTFVTTIAGALGIDPSSLKVQEEEECCLGDGAPSHRQFRHTNKQDGNGRVCGQKAVLEVVTGHAYDTLRR